MADDEPTASDYENAGNQALQRLDYLDFSPELQRADARISAGDNFTAAAGC